VERKQYSIRWVALKPQQGLSNVAWAFATLNHKAPSLFHAIARAAPVCIADFTAHSLANTVWEFATLEHEAPLLFDAIATNAQERIDEFNPQALFNTAWAYATLNHESKSLFDAIAKAAAFATSNHQAPSLLDACHCKRAERKIDNFKPQEVSNTLWAFARLNHKTLSLFNVVASKEGRNCKSSSSTS
jgi:hypothetical protein